MSEQPYVIEMRHISKTFGSLKANDDITMQLKRGEIHALQMQVPFTLIPAQKAPSGKTERAVVYRSDFCYTDADNHMVVEDVKGYRRGAGYAVFRIKAKLMLHKFGIEIKEV